MADVINSSYQSVVALCIMGMEQFFKNYGSLYVGCRSTHTKLDAEYNQNYSNK